MVKVVEKTKPEAEPVEEIDFEQSVANLTRVKPKIQSVVHDAFDRIDRLMRQRPGR